MTKHLLVALSSLGVLFVAAPASADTTTMPMIVIEGRAPRPSVIVEVRTARMQLPPSTPTLAAVTKIENAAKKDPF
jgi:hypothetical protein